MSFKRSARECLQDIVQNAAWIAEDLDDVSAETFGADRRRRDAVERCVERVCEAVAHLGPRAESLMPGHPWVDIRNMGNRLRHAYHRVDADIVWRTATRDIPALAADARRALDRLAKG